MSELLENLKLLISLAAVFLAIAGFYYTTQHRLDHLENKIVELEAADKKIKKTLSNKQNKRR
jgi:Tfp pilus assembly protein PilO